MSGSGTGLSPGTGRVAAPPIRFGPWSAALAALCIATAIALLPALSGGLVWDDLANIVHNAHVQRLDGALVSWAFTRPLQGHYQPLTWLSLAVDYALGGGKPFPFHLTSLLLHLLNVVLFAAVARRLFERVAAGRDRLSAGWAPVAAWVSAAVFALHPMRAESVAWATERRDVLSGAFLLLSLAAYLRWERESPPRSRTWFAAALVAFAASLLSKALGLAFPLVLLVLDIYPLKRSRVRGRWGAGLLRLALEKVPFLLLTLAFGLLALWAQASSGALVPLARYGIVQRLGQIAYGILYYPRAIFATGWSALYERPFRLDPFEPRFVISLVVVLALTVAAVWMRRRFPAGLAVWVCYLALLAPVSGLAQSGSQLVADRYSYLAGLPWAMLLGAIVATALVRVRVRMARAGVALVALGVLSTWGVATWRHASAWHDERTLWQRVIERGPSAMAYNNLGRIELESGNTNRALELFRRALEVAPTFPLPWRNLQELFERRVPGLDRREVDRTIEALHAGLPGQGESADARYIVGLAEAEGGQGEEALAHFREAVARKPEHARAWARLAETLMVRGEYADAAKAFGRAAELRPRDSGVWTGLGICLSGSGRVGEAREALRRALRLDPGNERARLHLTRIESSGAPG